jgi:hypothetical protein
LFEGATLGLYERDGLLDTSGVGLLEGKLDGLNETDGLLDACGVGLLDACGVGLLEGTLDGSVLGFSDGSVDGSSLGLKLGDEDGDKYGNEEGADSSSTAEYTTRPFQILGRNVEPKRPDFPAPWRIEMLSSETKMLPSESPFV